MAELLGKYRAEVVDIRDPKKMGRVRLKIPSVLGDKVSAWALPCVPFGTDFVGLEVGDIVWVEFEEGHIDRPIVVGTWWAERKTPIEELNVTYNSDLKRRRIKTKKGHVIDLIDKNGNECIEIKDIKGNVIKIDSNSNTIIISANNIVLRGNVKVEGNLDY